MSSYPNKKYKFKKSTKRKIFLSNELKKALLVAFLEAKQNKVYLTLELLLYGLVSQQNSLAGQLIETTISQYKNNKNLTCQVISNRIKEINNHNFQFKLKSNTNDLVVFSAEIWDENAITPWLSSEVKEILKLSIKSLVPSQTNITVLSTKNILFELLNKESIRNLLTQLIN